MKKILPQIRTMPTYIISVYVFAFTIAAYTVYAAEEKDGTSEFSVNTNTSPWDYMYIPELEHQLPLKTLLVDQETGMSVIKMKYEAGFTNTWHTHPTGHGMYVLDGILETSIGDFGPGEFVWFPEGQRMYHGAKEENDAIFIGIANKELDIYYEE